MRTIKTDSLGLEILNSVSIQETKTEIKTFKKIENLLLNDKLIIFEIYENNKIFGYFTLEEKVYDNWVSEYKIQGVEI